MNKVIDSILNHRSIRNYTSEGIDPIMLKNIVASAQAAPSSINGQQMSIIVIKDQKKKEEIAALTGGQEWIAQAPVFLVFVADFYRAKLAADKTNEELVIPSNIEGTLVGSIDVGLAMGNAIAAAESLGLGTVCIGGIRNNPDRMIELLDLPEYVYPMVGLCIGHPVEDQIPAKKPRFPEEAVVHQEVYNRDLHAILDDYDETIKAYMHERTGGQHVHDWSGFISGIYNKVYYPTVSPTMKKQKLDNE